MVDLRDIMIKRLESLPAIINKKGFVVEKALRQLIEIISKGYGHYRYEIFWSLVDKIREFGIYKQSALLSVIYNNFEYDDNIHSAQLTEFYKDKPAEVVFHKIKRIEQRIHNRYRKLICKKLAKGKNPVGIILDMLHVTNAKIISKYGYFKRKYKQEYQREIKSINKRWDAIGSLGKIADELGQLKSIYVYFDGKNDPRPLKISDILNVIPTLIDLVKNDNVKPIKPSVFFYSGIIYHNSKSEYDKYLINKNTSDKVWSHMKTYFNDNLNESYEFRLNYLNAGRVQLVNMNELFMFNEGWDEDLLDYDLILPAEWNDTYNILVNKYKNNGNIICYPLSQGNSLLSYYDVNNINMLLNHYLLETDKGIIKLLIHSNYSAYQIQKSSGVNHSIITRLRKGKHNIGDLNFNTVHALVLFYKNTDEYKKLLSTNIVL